MFGSNKTYFADSPVVIDINGLQWPSEGGKPKSPFNIVRVEVNYDGATVGNFDADTGGQSSISFDISSALRAIWSDYDFASDVAKGQSALTSNGAQSYQRTMRQYSLHVYTEYLASDDGGVPTTTDCGEFSGGQCLIGGLTEWERSTIDSVANADVSHWEHTGVRNGDASTKPVSSPERVGKTSITSWVDVASGYTKTIFYPAAIQPAADDTIGSSQGWTGHAPLVLRDSIPYTDFLFVNRRGAVETCSAPMMEAMSLSAESKSYGRVERPTFKPSRSLLALSSGGRRSWSMSSGYQTRQWLEWWITDFLMARQWWMLYKGSYVPVIVEPAKKSNPVYDRSKQKMESVEFTVTLALEG